MTDIVSYFIFTLFYSLMLNHSNATKKMKKFTLLLSELFLGFASYVEPNKYDLQTGDDSKKGSPWLKTVDLAYLNTANQTIAKDWTRLTT